MQQINIEQRQASARLLQHLPANVIKETTSHFDQKHVNKNLQSSANRLEKSLNQQLQTDLDTQRSLSSCPTYFSLSRQSVDTRECGTQITTLTPTKEFKEDEEEDQDLIDHPSSPIETNQVLLVEEDPFEEVEFMPVSSGFGYYPYNYPTTMTKRVPQTQIMSRAPQFRDNRNGYNPRNPPKSKLPTVRPTAVKQSPRSDTFVLPNKQNDRNSKFSKTNGTRRVPPKEPPPPPPPPPLPPAPVDKNRAESLRRNPAHRSLRKVFSPSYSDQQDLGRKPVRFANRTNHPPSSTPAYHRKSNQPRRIQIADNDYVIQRHRSPPAEHVYDDYRSDNSIERTRHKQYVRVVRDAPYEDNGNAYYVEPAPPRRTKVIRHRPPSTEYVYVDEIPAHHRRSRRPEVVYVEDDRPVEYEDEYIYVDEDGNEVDFVNNRRRKTPEYVEYIYEDEHDRKHTHKPKVIYVDDDNQPKNHERNKKKSKQPSSTRIVYE